MIHEESIFLVRMVMSEMWELLLATSDTPEQARDHLRRCVDQIDFHPGTHTLTQQGRAGDALAVATEQADAMVDAMYYTYNAASKAGIDLDPLFREVHAANERKRFPDGQFHRRADGKVEKPPGWTPPDATSIMASQVMRE
jgi:predicted HAD superfamily Cof-like phosphohydrolase